MTYGQTDTAYVPCQDALLIHPYTIYIMRNKHKVLYKNRNNYVEIVINLNKAFFFPERKKERERERCT